MHSHCSGVRALQKAPTLTVLEAPALEILEGTSGHFAHNPHRPGMQLHESVADAYELLSGKSYAVASAEKQASSLAAHPIYVRPSAQAERSSTAHAPAGAGASSRHNAGSPTRSPDSLSRRGVEPSQLQSRIRADLQSKSLEDLARAAASKEAFEDLMQKFLPLTAMGQRYVVAKLKILQLAQENKDLQEVRSCADCGSLHACLALRHELGRLDLLSCSAACM